jgi:hypothetical protein
MPPKQHWPCALVAGDLPIMTARRTTVLVIVASFVLAAQRLGVDYEPVLFMIVACTGTSAAFSMNGPLVVLNLRLQRSRLGTEAVADI